MKVVYVPIRGERSVKYKFEEDKVIAHMDGQQETFNFQGMPNGHADSITADHLPVCPLMAAARVEGELEVTLRHWYGAEAESWEKEQREEIV